MQELPPLPEPLKEKFGIRVFCVDDMKEYAIAALAQQAAEIERLREHAVILANTAIYAERERCAEICSGIGDGNQWSDAHSCAEAIRRETP